MAQIKLQIVKQIGCVDAPLPLFMTQIFNEPVIASCFFLVGSLVEKTQIVHATLKSVTIL